MISHCRSIISSSTAAAAGTEGDVHFLAFPRTGDLTRVYLMVDIARQAEFTGPQRLEHFVAALRKVTAFPAAAALAEGEPAGPAGGSPMTDSWTTTPPVVPGAVLAPPPAAVVAAPPPATVVTVAAVVVAPAGDVVAGMLGVLGVLAAGLSSDPHAASSPTPTTRSPSTA